MNSVSLSLFDQRKKDSDYLLLGIFFYRIEKMGVYLMTTRYQIQSTDYRKQDGP